MKMLNIVTHNGKFHADDVFAVALITLYLDSKSQLYNIVRTRNVDVISEADMVVDVGREYNSTKYRFDHHQGDIAARDNGVPYASFGLVWKHLSPWLFSEEFISFFDSNFVQLIDAIDCGYELFTPHISGVDETSYDSLLRILYAPSWQQESLESWDAGFQLAVTFAKEVISKSYNNFVCKKEAEAILAEILEKTTNKSIVVLEKRMPLVDSAHMNSLFADTDYIISPELDGKFGILALDEVGKRFCPKKPFPKAWRGLVGKELEDASGIKGAGFCHLTGFFAVTENIESAVKFAQKAQSFKGS